MDTEILRRCPPLSYLEKNDEVSWLSPINWPIVSGKDFIKSKSLIRQLKWLIIWILRVEIPEFSSWFWLFFGLFLGFLGCHFKHSVSIEIVTEIRRHFSKVYIAGFWSTISSSIMATETTIFYQKIFAPFLIPVIVKSWPVIVIEFWVLVGLHSINYRGISW